VMHGTATAARSVPQPLSLLMKKLLSSSNAAVMGAAFAGLVLAACTSVADRTAAPAALKAVSTMASLAEADVGYIKACKASGPAGTYWFAPTVSGGGDYYLDGHEKTSVYFDGTHLACAESNLYRPLPTSSWDGGVTADVTITELVPEGMHVKQIDVCSSAVCPIFSVYDVDHVTLTVGLMDRRKIHFHNEIVIPPTANCVALTGVAGVPLTPTSLTASGGSGGPYTFSATGLPAGVTLSPDGVLSGTPEVSGSFNYTVTVTDSDGHTGSGGTCSVDISVPPSANCVAISGIAGVPITPVALTGSGGAGAPYTFSAIGLPAGLTLSASGVLSGTPSVSGVFNYVVTVTDKDGNSGSGGTCAVNISERPSVACASVTAVQGVAITPVALVASGGAGGPYTFSATGLPAGLSLSSSGVLSGTPTVSGTFSYSVTVTDKDGNSTTGTTCSVKVNPPPFSGETASGAGFRYPNTSNWFMYSPYKTTKTDLIAGQFYDAGDIYMSRTSTSTIIRIELQNGFQWAGAAENLKINPYLTAPTDYVQPGAFMYKFTVSGNVVTVTIPGTSAKFYGIHGDVMRPLP
jgi:hypothetical protein